MTKAELIDAVYTLLKESNIRKPVAVPKQQFTITDDEGNSRMFTVKRKDREALYTMVDVRNIINMMINVIVDSMQHGIPIYLPRIGTLCVQYREASKVRIPGSRQWADIPAHYVPKMNFSEAMRDAARIYEAYISENAPPEAPTKPKRGRGRPRNAERLAEIFSQMNNESADEDVENIDCDGD